MKISAALFEFLCIDRWGSQPELFSDTGGPIGSLMLGSTPFGYGTDPASFDPVSRVDSAHSMNVGCSRNAGFRPVRRSARPPSAWPSCFRSGVVIPISAVKRAKPRARTLRPPCVPHLPSRPPRWRGFGLSDGRPTGRPAHPPGESEMSHDPAG